MVNLMQLNFAFTFFGTFIILSLVFVSLLIWYQNKTAKATINKFLSIATNFNPVIFRNINLSYWEISGMKYWGFPNNKCDIYLFENYLVLCRRVEFIVKVNFDPVIIASEAKQVNADLNFLFYYKPEYIYFKKVIKSEVEIKIKDPVFKHRIIEITLMGLTSDQVTKLDKINNWGLSEIITQP